MSKSAYYYLFLEPIPTEPNARLDENYNSPKYKRIQELLTQSKVKTIIPIGNNQDPVILKNITSGKTPAGIEYIEDGVPFIGASNIQCSEIVLDTAPRISMEEHESRLKGSQIKEGNLVISIAGTVGHCAVCMQEDELNCNQAVAILDLETETILPEYLMYYLNSEIGQLLFGKFQHESDQPNINLEEIKRISVILPKIEEQKRIIKKCSVIHNKIVEAQKQIHILKKNLDKPIRDAVGQKTKGYENLYKSNFYTLMPENLEINTQRIDYVSNHPLFDWVREFRTSKNVIPLKNCIDYERFSYGLSESAITYGEVGFLNVQHLSFEGRIIFNPPTFLNECPDGKRLKENDVLIARTGHTLGKAALITKEYEGFTFGSFCIRFALNSEEYFPDFIAQYINSIYGQAQIMMLKAGSGKNNINQDHIAGIRIPIMDKNKQKQILDNYKKSLQNLSTLEVEEQKQNEQMNEEVAKELFN